MDPTTISQIEYMIHTITQAAHLGLSECMRDRQAPNMGALAQAAAIIESLATARLALLASPTVTREEHPTP